MWNTIISCTLILLGAVIMLLCIYRSKVFRSFLPYISSGSKQLVSQWLIFHRILMSGFFVGYIVVALSIYLELKIINNIFTSVIFLFGSIFVFLGILIYLKLLNELQTTLRGLMPICAWCKKILNNGSNPDDKSSWRAIDMFIKDKTDVEFTHTICPGCYQSKYGELPDVEQVSQTM